MHSTIGTIALAKDLACIRGSSDILDLVDGRDHLGRLEELLEATNNDESMIKPSRRNDSLLDGEIANPNGLGPSTLIYLLHPRPRLVEDGRVISDELTIFVQCVNAVHCNPGQHS